MALISKYSLNGNANDLVWSNNWTALNVTWVDGKMNWWANFNWTNSNIIWITNAWYAWANGDWSISLLLNISSLPWINQRRYIYTCVDSTTSSDFQFNLFNNWWTQTIVYWRWRFNISYANSFNYTLPLNKWIHVTIIQNWNNNYLYVEWVLLTQSTMFWNWIWWYNFWIIWSNVTNTELLSWSLDEFEIYNHVLTETEIKNKYLYYNGFFNV